MQLKSKIKNLALKNKTPAQAVLQNFMLERLLERITVSKYKDIFILLFLHIPVTEGNIRFSRLLTNLVVVEGV